MSFDYSYVLPPTGPSENAQVREMFEDVKAYVNTLISGGGSGAPNNAPFVTIGNDATLTAERALTAGTGISLTDGGAGSTVTLANTGVLSAIGTANQVIVSGATGNVTFTLPQSIATSSAVEFGRLLLADGSLAAPSLYWDFAGVPIGFDAAGSGLRMSVNGTTISSSSSLSSIFSVGVSVPSLTLANSGGIVFTSAPFASYNLVFPVANGAANEMLINDGSGNLSWRKSATPALDNLASTAVNVNLLPGTPDIYQLGNSTYRWGNILTSGSISLYTDAPFTWATALRSAAGMSGNLLFILPVNSGSPNQVLTTDGSGNLSWSAGTGSGAATIQLDNLASVAINTTLVSDTNNTDDLGSSAIAWKDLFLTGGIKSGGSTLATNAEIGYLSGVTSSIQTQLNAGTTGKANVALDNLAATAVNDHIIPVTTNTKDLGSTSKYWNNIYSSNIYTSDVNITGPISFKETGGGTDVVQIIAPAAVTASHTLKLPGTQGGANTYLTNDGSGNLTWSNAAGTGTVNTGTANRLAYYATSTNAVSSLTAITASRALASDSNGLPVAATTTATELGYVNGVTSAIQTQIDLKAPIASPTFTGTVVAPTIDVTTISHTGGTAIKGTNTNNNAAAGDIGEYFSSAVATGSAVSATGSSQFFDITSITLSAGDWDISAVFVLQLSGATASAATGGIGTASGNNGAGLVQGDNRQNFAIPAAGEGDIGECIPAYRVSISGSTTYYLKFLAIYSAGTPKAFGRISARRVR